MGELIGRNVKLVALGVKLIGRNVKLVKLTSKENVFVISHKGDTLQDKFRSVIKFEKVKNFSHVS